MGLDRGTLAKVDRRILSALDHTEAVQLVKVPVSDAVWSAWRRYCEALGMSMGRGIAVLISHELSSVIDDDFEQRGRLLQAKMRQIEEREAALEKWARRLEGQYGSTPGWAPPPFEPD